MCWRAVPHTLRNPTLDTVTFVGSCASTGAHAAGRGTDTGVRCGVRVTPLRTGVPCPLSTGGTRSRVITSKLLVVYQANTEEIFFTSADSDSKSRRRRCCAAFIRARAKRRIAWQSHGDTAAARLRPSRESRFRLAACAPVEAQLPTNVPPIFACFWKIKISVARTDTRKVRARAGKVTSEFRI